MKQKRNEKILVSGENDRERERKKRERERKLLKVAVPVHIVVKCIQTLATISRWRLLSFSCRKLNSGAEFGLLRFGSDVRT